MCYSKLLVALTAFVIAVTSASAQYVVSSLADLPDSDLTDEVYAPRTLRAAIENINKRGIAATILIDPSLEYQKITLTSTLPGAIPKITFDAKGVQLDGNNNVAVNMGFIVRGDGSEVRNLLIERINGSGLVWQASDGVIEMVVVRNCNGPGINFNGAKRNKVGGALKGYYSNYIYGCTGTGGHGLSFIVGSSDNEVQYNAIGIDETYAKRPNSRYGIFAEDAGLNIHHNVVSGNEYGGIYVDGRGRALFTRIYSNLVGVTESVSDTIPNLGSGITITKSSDDTIRNNIVGGNRGNGIFVADATCRRITIASNIVGVDRSTRKVLPNLAGIQLNGADHIVKFNVVSGNDGNGISTSANTTVIEGNIVGLDSSRSIAVGNGGNGIHATFLSDAVIGPADSLGDWNVISANGGSGIVLGSAGMTNVRVTRNLIGSNWNMDSAKANGGNGILVRYDASNIVIENNYIASNWQNGIHIERNVVIFLDPNRAPMYQRPHNITVRRNLIGLAYDSDSVMHHGLNGISVLNADSIFIEDNEISGCNHNGIQIANDSTRLVKIRRNVIGAIETDSASFSNGRSGIYIDGAKDVMIGDAVDGIDYNIIGYNNWYGVQCSYNAHNVKILANRICENAYGGIALDTFGVYYQKYAYDSADADVGSNHLQNTPWLWVGAALNGKLRVAGYLHSTPNESFRIDVALDTIVPDTLWYSISGCDPVAWFAVRTNDEGYAVFDTSLTVADIDTRLAKHPIVTTTATGTHGTSQFSLKPMLPPDEPLVIDLAVDIDTARSTVGADGKVELWATITNLGIDIATAVVVHDSLGVAFTADTMEISKGVIDRYDSTVIATIPTLGRGESVTMRVVGGTRRVGTYHRTVTARSAQMDIDPANNRDAIAFDITVANGVAGDGEHAPVLRYRADGTLEILPSRTDNYTVYCYDLGGRVLAVFNAEHTEAGNAIVITPPRGTLGVSLKGSHGGTLRTLH